jgi:voltage-gated potassium channel
LILLSVYAIAYTTAGFVQFLTEGEVYAILGQSRMHSQIEGMSGHTIIAGFGRVGGLICEELESCGVAFVVVEASADRVPELTRRGYPHVRGDATEEQTLLDAGLMRAKTLVSVLPNDANNVFITLTARQLSPDVEIIARAEQPSAAKTLHHAGARHVVMPAAIGAHRIAALLTRPKAVAFAELVTHHPGLELQMLAMVIREGSPLVGKSLVEADVRRKTDVNISAVRTRDGRVEIPVMRSHVFEAGESLMVVGRVDDLDHFQTEFGLVIELGEATNSWNAAFVRPK